MPRARIISKVKRDKREGRYRSLEEKYQERKRNKKQEDEEIMDDKTYNFLIYSYGTLLLIFIIGCFILGALVIK